MNQPPYPYTPDAFYLIVPEGITPLVTKAYESAWGVTDEILCYYNDILIGLAFTPTRPIKELPHIQCLVITLVPKLDKRREYPWPSPQQFNEVLLHIIRTEQKWLLHCERNCEQYPVEEFSGDINKTEMLFGLAIQYCAGLSNECPNFISHINGANK